MQVVLKSMGNISYKFSAETIPNFFQFLDIGLEIISAMMHKGISKTANSEFELDLGLLLHAQHLHLKLLYVWLFFLKCLVSQPIKNQSN